MNKNNVVLIDPYLPNKGDQAIFFSVVSNLKKQFPECKISLFSTSAAQMPFKQMQNYKCRFFSWGLREKVKILLGFSNCQSKLLKDSFLVVATNGFMVSPDWGFRGALEFVLNIAVAKRLGVPFVVNSQSIETRGFSLIERMVLFPLFWWYFKYPEKIFVREKSRLSSVKRFSGGNAFYSPDSVLLNDNIDFNAVLNGLSKNRFFSIRPLSVGLFPNTSMFKKVKKKFFLRLVEKSVLKLVRDGYNVYICRHAFEDLGLCREIYALFSSKRVHLIEDDLQCFELDNLVKKFDFVLAFRYHSIITSFRFGVPVLTVGWDEKYNELMRTFNQTAYCFDGRKPFLVKDFLNAIGCLEHHNFEQSIEIFNRLQDLRLANKTFKVME